METVVELERQAGNLPNVGDLTNADLANSEMSQDREHTIHLGQGQDYAEDNDSEEGSVDSNGDPVERGMAEGAALQKMQQLAKKIYDTTP